ncbi:hypothetical protein SAMD00019534_017370 [Acytostelium subglobosum LB1]|uniref:hypothetical protein n=1 Tax=Acytostelium subglobosum LB1 TaxID=1410327 RepID=UPI000644949D|nr:hypothetical protein SAMD00019534_017370 [Acytostelium subglobosum LB1]GAM18562.1 hypothetical protein SAMD00019534_017370 [Acytostelium subglobosum LB1]|eukprot:XP_012757782.1 hypothetical protein SAMD00019534_017370 [Acytostelium subglobosum LB1]
MSTTTTTTSTTTTQSYGSSFGGGTSTPGLNSESLAASYSYFNANNNNQSNDNDSVSRTSGDLNSSSGEYAHHSSISRYNSTTNGGDAVLTCWHDPESPSFATYTDSSIHSNDRQCSNYADRVLFSNKYYYAYIFMIGINFVLLLWLIVNIIKKQTVLPSHWLFVLLDIMVNLALLAEVTLQIISQRSRYFTLWSNRFDLFVLVLSLGGLLMYLVAHNTVQFDYEGIVIIFLTALRYGVQFLRLLAMIKSQKARGSAFSSRVDFTELKGSDLSFDVDNSPF